MPNFEEQLWAELAQHQVTTPSRAPVAPLQRHRAPRRSRAWVAVLLIATVLTGVLALATSPWDGAPSFLARAASALTPGSNVVLYESWENTLVPVGRKGLERSSTAAPDQLWIEGAYPHRYRVVLQPPAGNRFARSRAARSSGLRPTLAPWADTVYWSGSQERLEKMQHALEGHPLELGGTLRHDGSRRTLANAKTLTFVPPKELWSARLFVSFGPPLPGPGAEIDANVADPVSELRAAIAEGRAHEAGTVRLAGRKLERIGFDAPPVGTPTTLVDPTYVYAHSYAYVEPETLHPVEIVLNGTHYRILAYEYLPATAANLALTSVRARHPSAEVVPERPSSSPAR